MNHLHICNLCTTYTSRTQAVVAINNVSLDVHNGMFGLLGPNGAGKSSLMKTIVGLQRPNSGIILFNGVDVLADTSAIKRHLGFLPQDFGVYPNISAEALLTHIAALKGLPKSRERKDHIHALLAQTNLYQHRHHDVGAFSGGMRQRFGIAQALLGSPKIVIVDEPTAGLDPEERNRCNNILSELSQELIVILSTHLVEDVRNLCSTMAIMHHGRVLAEGKPSEFLDSLTGKLWQKIIHKHEQQGYEAAYTVISSQLVQGRVKIHIVADTAPEHGFEPVSASLEDVYFSVLSAG